MLQLVDARERTFRFAIATGRMADIGLIHARQQAEGNQPCFGRAVQPCPHAHCRWHRDCMELMAFVPRPVGPDWSSLRGLVHDSPDPTVPTLETPTADSVSARAIA
jgi:hypothetical protein